MGGAGWTISTVVDVINKWGYLHDICHVVAAVGEVLHVDKGNAVVWWE